MKDEKKQSRRSFLFKVGAGLAGLTGLAGLSKLAKAMADNLKPHAPVPIPICGVDACVAVFDCHVFYGCQDFQCGPSWVGDFSCWNDFDCLGGGPAGINFKCVGSEPGTQFHCHSSFDCDTVPDPFWCDPGDFWCAPGQYNCHGGPGGGYVQPPVGCKPLL